MPPLLAISLILGVFLLVLLPAPALAAARPQNTLAVTRPAWFSCVHVVRPGETMVSVALSQGTSPFFLGFMNGMTDFDVIFPGFVLTVPCVFPVPSVIFPQPIVQPSPIANICNIHIVQRGEWLSRIAVQFGVTWQSIAAVNGLINPNIIFPGMRLLIPCSAVSPISPQPAPQPVPSPAPAAGTFNAAMVNLMFSPATINIRVGQSVVWHDMDSVQHSATQGTCSGNVCMPAAGGFDTGILNPGQTSAPIAFNSPGTFHFFCRVHGAMMQGNVVVTP